MSDFICRRVMFTMRIMTWKRVSNGPSMIITSYNWKRTSTTSRTFLSLRARFNSKISGPRWKFSTMVFHSSSTGQVVPGSRPRSGRKRGTKSCQVYTLDPLHIIEFTALTRTKSWICSATWVAFLTWYWSLVLF